MYTELTKLVSFAADLPMYGFVVHSQNGTDYKLAATVNTQIDIKDTKVRIQDFTAPLNTDTRYIKIVAKQYGPLPDWHESKGSPSYIFADEITIDN